MISDETFRQLISKCFSHQKMPSRVAIALSGGVDSVCLTWLLSQYRLKYRPDLKIYAITIDHDYRSGSNDEAKRVGELVQKWNVEHIIGKLEYDKDVHSITNFEEVARFARYDRMREICEKLGTSTLFLGHNLDDQLETFITRLQRNSSILGLKGMEAQALIPIHQSIAQVPIRIYRPLLDCLKQDIIKTCQTHRIEWFEDITNQDINLTPRNLVRYLINQKVPQICKVNLDFDCISKKNLLSTYLEVVHFSNLINQRSKALYTDLKQADLIQENDGNGSAIIRLPSNLLIEENKIILSRFLFKYLYPISSVKHYHWSYSKIDRHFIPKVLNFNNSKQSKLKLTYMNLIFDMKKHQDMLLLNISRQPLIKTENVQLDYVLSPEWGEWVLFDRRYWLRFKSNEPKIIGIKLYQHQKLLENVHPSLKHLVTKDMNNSPVVLINDEIVLFPTYNLSAFTGIESEWCLKPNVFSL